MHTPQIYSNRGLLALLVLVVAGCRPPSSPPATGIAPPPAQRNSSAPTSSTAASNNPLVGTWALNRPDERPPQSEILRFTFQSDGTGHDIIGPFKWSTDSGSKHLILDYEDANNGKGVKIDLDWGSGVAGDSVNIHFVESASLADQTLYRQH